MIDLTEPKWRFEERVRSLMDRHNQTRLDAELMTETEIRTKETSKRCACGEVADVFDPKDKKNIYCGHCEPKYVIETKEQPEEQCLKTSA